MAKNLPPGFRFHPTDEELILHYLRNRAASNPCPVSIIAEVDIYKFDPWDLPAKAAFGEREWYFFSPRDRKYPNGERPNRAAASGYWKATGTDKPIVRSSSNNNNNHNNEGKAIIGVKKALVFYKGRPPKGIKTNWIMHEYRLNDPKSRPSILKLKGSMRLDEWVLCRIYKKSYQMQEKNMIEPEHQEEEPTLEDVLSSLPSITSQPSLKIPRSASFTQFLETVDQSMLSRLIFGTTNDSSEESEPTNPINNSKNHHHSNIDISNSNNKYQSPLETSSLATAPQPEIEQKRPYSMMANGPNDGFLPSKRPNLSMNNTNFKEHLLVPQYQFHSSGAPYQLSQQTFFNNHILLNPLLEFQ
ncbi:hypothetical protein AMTRI_Chr01g126280 [Amborella trichopoda]|uniref:NAC domain-containing protein n=1 Tax=Amborella trichopoda TaxID=13333 RepID=W1NQU5_AMBTC|nr:NAC transcription factor 29 [Amborella trichopoda]ERM97194.1 hypothetical protein AMTR_s00119p00040230 [Amborella trichopoda]|eukprot:XP_006829778.1 NAC transcription factor 29 [Amborella trichopoda]